MILHYGENSGWIKYFWPAYSLASIVNRVWNFKPSFTVGFVFAMADIILISLSDMSTNLALFGDMLAILAALTWAFYSNIITQLSRLGYEAIAMTKRIFM